jgi:hypothetical protein
MHGAQTPIPNIDALDGVPEDSIERIFVDAIVVAEML